MRKLLLIMVASHVAAIASAIGPAIAPAYAQDISRLGGDLSSVLEGRHSIQVHAPNVVDEGRRKRQLSGFTIFHKAFGKSDGLGPQFINDSCGGCHIENGRGPVKVARGNGDEGTMVVKVSRKGLHSNGAPRDVPGIGEQLLDQSVKGVPKVRITLKWKEIRGEYPDGTKYKLRRPILDFSIKGMSTRKLVTSIRMTPPVIGPGLLEAIPDSKIMELNDPADADNDGISGHPNYVPDPVNGQFRIGRFGFKSSNATVAQQSGAALRHDMGVSNSIFKIPGQPQELSDEEMDFLVIYQKIAGVPFASNQDNPDVIAGKHLFQQVGCHKCHTMTMTTGEYEDPELSNQVFHPFTDMLLHDMGSGLADKRAEFSAKGSEWRTTPLWGLGFSRRLARRKAAFLHDGRARTIEEAILWHGGEANRSTKAFKKLKARERKQLLRFLDSL